MNPMLLAMLGLNNPSALAGAGAAAGVAPPSSAGVGPAAGAGVGGGGGLGALLTGLQGVQAPQQPPALPPVAPRGGGSIDPRFLQILLSQLGPQSSGSIPSLGQLLTQ